MTQSALENRRIRSIAQEYRDSGYEVIIKPGRADLPEFLANCDIDLLAQNGKENVVVELKTRTSLSKSDNLLRLAELLQNRHEWRLELVVTNPREGKKEHYPDEQVVQLLDAHEVEERFRQVENLLEQDQVIVAMLLAWTAVEATLRRVAHFNGVRLREQSPIYIIKQLFSVGILDRNQYEILDESVHVRITIMHGFKMKQIQHQRIKNLIDTARSLLQAQTFVHA